MTHKVAERACQDIGYSFLARRQETNLKSQQVSCCLAIFKATQANVVRLNLYGRVDIDEKAGGLLVAEQFGMRFYVYNEFPEGSGANGRLNPEWLVRPKASEADANVTLKYHDVKFKLSFPYLGKPVTIECAATFPYLTTEGRSLTKGTILKRMNLPGDQEIAKADANAIKNKQKVCHL